MIASKETGNLLDRIERTTGHKLRYRFEIATLIELAARNRQQSIFEDIIFFAKFLRNSYTVMQRIGTADEGYPKLSAEFRDGLEKFSTLIKTLVKEGPDEIKNSFITTFFTMSQESMNHLLQLASDLSWVKNYSIDTKQPLFQ